MDNSPARGTRDLLPSAVATRDHVLATITEVYHRFGYQRIETPALEDITRLTGGQGGENEKLVFQVLRRGLPGTVEAGTPLAELVDLGLRFDLTVPLTRFYGNNQATLPLPFRSFQFGPVWRAERPQKGRYRQFYQCDIDLIGEPSVLAEVELIEATAQALAGVGLSGTTVRLSDRRFLSALAAAVGLAEETWSTFFIGLDKLDKIGWDGVRAELTGRDLPASSVDAARERIEALTGLSADKVADTLSDTVPSLDDSVVADLGTVAGCLDELSGLTWEFDPTLVRGMGYYTGQIFEVGHPSVPFSLAGGGRYDKLIGRTLGKDVPACGFSIGFERIVDMLGELPRKDSVAVLFESDVPLANVFRVAREVRSGGRTAAVQPRSGKFGAQLGRLEAAGFTSLIHLKADTEQPEERPLGK
ncbi:histidine--tRNA ligase [Kutzneria kofuensis]|nr:histidine--tRNA ligase [Kutzneria kofuensis]